MKYKSADIVNKCSLRNKKCSNCAFLVFSNTISVKEMHRIKINNNQSVAPDNNAYGLECSQDMWINKSDDIKFLRKYRCHRFISFKKYPFATTPSLIKIYEENQDKFKWNMMFFTSLCSAIAACMSADLHKIIINFIANFIFDISQL